MAVDGGRLAARTLKSAGVEIVFGLHGGHLDTVLKGCRDEGIRLVDFRHEAAAVNAADAYSRVTGKLGVALVTSGPGLTNALAGITNAAADGRPLLVITSSPPTGESETLELQGGLDLVAMLGPVTKWSHKILAAHRVPDLLGLGIRKTLAYPRGPVVIDLPIDIAFTPVRDKAMHTPGEPVVPAQPCPSGEALEAAAELLKSAERPIIIVGEESLGGSLRGPLRDFAEATGIPVFTTTIALAGLPGAHPQNGGGVQSLPLCPAKPDLVILAGARQGMFAGGSSGSFVPAEAKVIQLHPDAAEIGRIYPVTVGLVGDVGSGLSGLSRARNWPDRSDWCTQATAARNFPEMMFGAATMEEDGIHPHRISKEIYRATPDDTILVFDGGEAAAWASWALGDKNIFGSLSLGYHGHLGVGQGYAIGAQLAYPDKRVLQIVGDGAIGFHLQEWDTMARHNLPIVTVIYNNACWGMSIHGQEAVNGPGGDIITRLAATRYDKVAEGFGCHGEFVDTVEGILPAIERAFAAGKPAVVNVATSAKVVHPVTISLLGDLAAQSEIIVPYYKNIPNTQP